MTGQMIRFQLDGRPKLISPARVKMLYYVSYGLINDEIAELMHIAPATVKDHLARVQRLLHTKNRAHSVRVGFECGLLVAQPRRSDGTAGARNFSDR